MRTTQTQFFSNEKIEQQLDLIHHMLQFGDELLLVSGEEGVGKSSQLQELIHRLGEGWQICYLSGKEISQISQLFEKIAQSFGYDYSTIPPAELLNGFKSHLEQKDSGKTYALLVDDAEQLDEASLEAIIHLSQLHNAKGRLLRVALFDDNQLRNSPSLKNIPLREISIEPLDSEQSQRYINFSIEHGKYALAHPPSEALQQQLIKKAAGLPGKIDVILQSFSQEPDGRMKTLNWRMAAAVLLLLAVAGGYLLNSKDDQPPADPPLTSTTTISTPSPISHDPVTPPSTQTETPAAVQKVTSPPPLPASTPKDHQDNKAILISEQLKQSESLLVIPNTPEKSGTAQKSDERIAVQPASQNLTGEAIPATPPVAAEKVAASDSSSNNSPPASPNRPLDQTPDKITGKILGKIPSKTPNNTPSKTERTPAKEKIEGRDWLSRQPATSFTIQLVAAGRKEALDDLIKREQLKKGLARFSFSREGKMIHVLTQGIYGSRTTAGESIKRYSSAVKPWIRPIGDIQQLFKNNPPATATSTSNMVAQDMKGVKDSAWLWSQDPAIVTIQLVAGENRDMLEPFVKQSLKIGVSAILETQRDNKPWFILLHGRYKTREEARSAITKLPQSLRSAKPWSRSFASVHDELSPPN